MITSYTVLKDRIQIFCDNHYQIEKFGGEFQSEINNFATKDERYPILYLSPINQRVYENVTEFDLDIYVMDLIDDDRSNINVILSDTNLILNDLYNYYKEGYDSNIDVIGNPSLSPLNNQLLDYAAGWVMRITLEVNNYTACQIPFIDGIPYVSSDNCQTNTYKYLTCETVTGCTSLQEYIAEQIANIPSGTTVTGFSYEASGNTLSIELSDNTTFDVIISEMSGMTFTGAVSATTYYGDGSNLTGINATEVTGFTFNPGNYQLELDQSNDNNFIVDLSILASDMTITGGTYNSSTGTATFTNNSGGTFDVTGFLTGFTDIYTTGATYDANTGEATFTRNDGNTYFVSGFFTGSTSTIPTLQEVTDSGNTTTNDIQLIDDAEVIFGSGGGILLNNGSRLREGTIDANYGGAKGIAQICSLSYELKWESGRLYVMDQTGTQIRQSLYNFNIIPSINDDNTKGYFVGTLWTLDDGTTYVCTDGTPGAAVWEVVDNDTYVTGFTNNNNVFTITDNDGQEYSTTLDTLTGLTINGILSATTISATTYNGDGSNLSGVYPSTNPSGFTSNTGTVTSVGLSMPSAFTVTNSPVTTNGTLTVAGAGLTSQYVRGDGSLANFPASTGGGASLSFYLNGSVSQGTFGGISFREMDRTPILGPGTDFTINTNGYIQSFITDAGVPNLLEIPAGNWNFETYFSASSGGGSPSFYVELYKWNGTTLSLIASNSANPEGITNGTTTDLYVSALAVPQTTLLATDRLAVRIYVNHSGRTIKLHTENGHLCQIITTFSTGLTALNGLTTQVQNLAVGTSGTDFGISSVAATHTFNLPTASATNRGALSSTDWTTFNGKQNALGFTPVTNARTISTTSPLAGGGDLTANRTFSIAQATTSVDGYLSATDWTTFNNKLSATITSPTGGDAIQYNATNARWENTKPFWTIDLMDNSSVEFYTVENVKINTITNIVGSPTITIADDGVPYTLTNTIATGSKITVTSNIQSVVKLNITY
jgi:hypothetical protein